MRVALFVVALIETAGALLWCFATYHAFTDPSGGFFTGLVVTVLGILIFGGIFVALHALKGDL